MKKIYFILTAMAVILSSAVKAQTVIAAWELSPYNTANNSIPGSINATSKDANLQTPVMSRGGGMTNVNLNYAYASRISDRGTNNDKTDAQTNGNYVQIELQSSTGFYLTLTKLKYRLRRNETNGPTSCQWRYSINGTNINDFTDIGSAASISYDNLGVDMPEVDLSTITSLKNVVSTSKIYLRIYFWGAGSAAAKDVGIGRYNGTADNVLSLEGFVVDSPLPVQLTSFTAKPQANVVQLNWQTASEQNNARFDILRSIDGINFIKIGQKAGAGNSSSTQNYSYLDTKPVSGTSYYALKQYDLNGNSKQYDAVPVKFNLSSNLITATATSSGIKVSVNAEKGEKASLSIYDISGTRLADSQVDLNQGFNEVEVNSFNLVSGKLYLVKLKTATQNQTVKVIK